MSANWTFRVIGPGMDTAIAMRDVDDLDLAYALLEKVRRNVQENRALELLQEAHFRNELASSGGKPFFPTDPDARYLAKLKSKATVVASGCWEPAGEQQNIGEFASPATTACDPDDAPINLDGFDKPGAVFKIGGKVVSREEGLAAFRAAFTSNRGEKQ